MRSVFTGRKFVCEEAVIGLLCAAAASYKRGKNLDDDPEFQARKADPKIYKFMYENKGATTLDKEAVRVVKKSPKWAPGRAKGAAVDVSFSIPINFKL